MQFFYKIAIILLYILNSLINNSNLNSEHKFSSIFNQQQNTNINLVTIQHMKLNNILGYSDIENIVWSPDGNTLGIISNGGIHFLDADTYQIKLFLPNTTNKFSTLSFYPDGQSFITATGIPIEGFSEDSQVRIFDSLNGNLLFEINEFYEPISDINVSVDGEYIIFFNTFSRSVSVKEISSNNLLMKLNNNSDKVAINSLNHFIAVANNEDVEIWNYHSQEKISTIFTKNQIQELEFDFEGTNLAISGDSKIEIWTINEPFKHTTLTGLGKLNFHETKPIITYLENDSKVIVYNLETDTQIATYQSDFPIKHLKFKPNSSLVTILGVNDSIMTWNFEQNTTSIITRGNYFPITTLEINEANNLLYVGNSIPFYLANFTDSSGINFLREWDLTSYRETILGEFTEAQSVIPIWYLNNNLEIFGISDDRKQILRGESLEVIYSSTQTIGGLEISPQKNFMAVRYMNKIEFIDIDTQTKVFDDILFDHAKIGDIEFIDNQNLIIGLDTGEVLQLNLVDNKIVNRFDINQEYDTGIYHIAFNSDTGLIAIADNSGDMHIGSANTQYEIRVVKSNIRVTSLIFNQDGSILIVGNENGKLTGYDTSEFTMIWEQQAYLGETRSVSNLMFNNIETILISSSSDGSISLWTIDTQ